MTTGRINQIATSGSVPPVRRGGHARPRRSGGTTRAPTAVLSSFFQMCPFHRTGETFLTTRLPGSTHTKCACRESAPFVLNTPTLLIPHSATLQEQERVSDPVGGYYAGPARNEGRGSSALHEPHRGSSTSTGAGTRSLRIVAANRQAHWPKGLSVPNSLTLSGRPSQSREVHSFLVICPVTIQSTLHVFWNMKGRSSFSAVVMNLALGLRLGAVSPKVLAAFRDALVSVLETEQKVFATLCRTYRLFLYLAHWMHRIRPVAQQKPRAFSPRYESNR